LLAWKKKKDGFRKIPLRFHYECFNKFSIEHTKL
jgi:hypothetical protein